MDPTLSVFQQAALEEIERLEHAFAQGDKMALFAAMRQCANRDLVMPEWVSRAFIAGYDRVLNCHVGSWDEAFGRPYPKGKHLASMRVDRLARFTIHARVRDIRNSEGAALDDDLFERVGAEFGVGKTRAKKLYYKVEKFWPRKS